MFTLSKYDPGTYKADLDQWTKPLDYNLMHESRHLGSATCYQPNPDVQGVTGQYPIHQRNDMSNIESDLRNLNRLATKDPLRKYPFIQETYLNPPEASVQDCAGAQKNFDEVFIYPKLEGTQYNREKQIQIPRFESLCLNPQSGSRIRSNNFIGMNTQLFNRDTFHRVAAQPIFDTSPQWSEADDTEIAVKFQKMKWNENIASNRRNLYFS